ncbi:MAG: peptidoglycan-binding protein, partial [Cyanobacteriota bacterium]|nr:peptidoglycan-binding protein [Cyanobacteriota bacterium]
VARKPVGPDWRTYGPMQVDWANWRAMGGSFVAPSLGRDGKPHYLAINCGARKLNATSQSGQWRTWDSPQNDDEQRLVSDLCSSKGG